LLQDHLEEIMPIVYTPTVGKASQHYSRVYRRGRGLFITPDYAGRIEEVLRSSAPFSDVRLMVVTDNEAILGIGDQGAGGMAISVGKLALYCAGAGIHPAKTLPISLDVGTNNQELLNDPLYLGYRQPRLTGEAYVALVDEFVAAARTVFPNVVIQWEDFRKDNALMILDRYRSVLPSFNDDIQGTGAVASACLRSACRILNSDFTKSRTLIYGAGAAGLGIARQIRTQLRLAGASEAQIAAAVLVLDSRGVLHAQRDKLDAYKHELAWSAESYRSLDLAADKEADLASVITAYGATALVGASGQGASFDRRVVAAMAANTSQPVILPMSNPTSISEAVPNDILQWTDGCALVATGSPFADVTINGRQQRVGQANNVFVFPGIGLGTIACEASEITSAMIGAAAGSLANCLSEADIADRCLVPRVSRLWEVCGHVAQAVADQAVADGVARVSDKLDERIAALRWRPHYPEICVAD
jgi:malic enzyme